MSSEGSVTSNGSQIRQFGLYRTIDARTEEFLRSSRKRQIKQGCACAAISTAITVTVVVSVILVYEYSINSETNVTKKNSVKPHWIGFMNDSEITSISSKFNKKINFDRTTLKLLPILLKALNKNRYLEKILEEYSGSSTPFIGKDTTEATYTRNFFSDSKNWLKLPTTKHSTLDYKTSPLTFWKNPTQRLEYLTKIRKIRDYQRMLNYFDKMVNDKVGPKKEFDYTENPLIDVTEPMKKIDKMSKIKAFKNFIKRKKLITKDKEDTAGCSCPKKMGLLLSKIITSLQDIVPQIIRKNFGIPPCENNTKPITFLNQDTTVRTVPRTKQRLGDFPPITIGLSGKSIFQIRDKLTTSSPNDIKTPKLCCTKSINPGKTTSTSTVATAAPTTETTEKSIKNGIIQLPIKKKCQSHEKTTLIYDLHAKPTKPTYDIETTKEPKGEQRATESIVPIKVTEPYTDEWLKTYPINSPNSRVNLPLFREEDYDYYITNKPSKTETGYENINVQNSGSLRSKVLHSREDIGNNENNFREMTMDYKPMENKHNDLGLTPMRKLADMIYIPQEKTGKVWKYSIDREQRPSSDSKSKKPTLYAKFRLSKSFEQQDTATTTTSNILYSTLKNIVQKDNLTPSVKNNNHKTTASPRPRPLISDPLMGENIGEEELQEEFGLRPTDTAPYKYKHSSTKKDISIENKKRKSKNKQNLSAWELLKNEEKIQKANLISKSMLPSMRPLYLEIQRNNDWRQDDHADYDTYNFNNNLFDIEK